MIRGSATACCGLVLALCAAPLRASGADDPFLEAERQEQEDLERLRAVNTGALEFLTDAPARTELHTQMSLRLGEASLREGWVDMRQCQSGLDGMALTEIVYRFADLRGLRVTGSRGIEAAHIEGQSVQLRGVAPGAEICVAAEVRILRALGAGRYRLTSGPYHRRFFDGYFPLRLSFSVEYPQDRLRWDSVEPAPRDGFAVSAEPGRVMIETRFSGMLTVELEFTQAGYATPQPPSPQ